MRKTIFLRSWNIIESSKRASKYHLPISFLAEKKDCISYHRKVQNKGFSETSNYHLSINFVTQKKSVFSITEKFKTRPFQGSVNIFQSHFRLKKRPYLTFPKRLKQGLFSNSKYHISINILAQKYHIFCLQKFQNQNF